MTAPTDAPVEERQRRAAASALALNGLVPGYAEEWVATGQWDPPGTGIWFAAETAAQLSANAERDGRASRDAEVAELSAYRAAWERYADHWHTAEMREHMGKVLAEELARKGTP